MAKKLKFKTVELADALGMAMRWVQKRTVIPALQGFLINAGYGVFSISATDGLSTDITVTISTDSDVEELVACVPADLLTRTIATLSKVTEDVELSFTNKNVTVLSGKKMSRISLFDPDNYPAMNIDFVSTGIDHEDLSVSVEEFARAVYLTKSAYDPKSPFPALENIYFDGEKVVSVDGYRLCLVEGLHILEEPKLINGETCYKIYAALSGKVDKIGVTTSGNRVVFYWDGGIITTTTSSYKFPKYMQLLSDEYETEFSVPKDELSVALALSKDYAEESMNLVIFEYTDAVLDIHAISNTGEYSGAILASNASGPSKKFGLSYRYIRDAITKMESENIYFGINDVQGMVAVHNSQDYVYGIMPMYVKEDDN